jgi:hypothetical protein
VGAADPFENNRVDALAVQQVGQEESRRAGADDADLRSDRLDIEIVTFFGLAGLAPGRVSPSDGTLDFDMPQSPNRTG